MSIYKGVTFNNVRKALYYIFYSAEYSELDAYKYILPMQQNFFNPIEELGEDTYLQYFIDEDDRITQDSFDYTTNFTNKLAIVSLRFIGKNAEDWAKSFHHLSKRADFARIIAGTCNGSYMEYVTAIKPTQVNFFGKNTNIAFDLTFGIAYKEEIVIDWKPLGDVTVASGDLK